MWRKAMLDGERLKLFDRTDERLAEMRRYL